MTNRPNNNARVIKIVLIAVLLLACTAAGMAWWLQRPPGQTIIERSEGRYHLRCSFDYPLPEKILGDAQSLEVWLTKQFSFLTPQSFQVRIHLFDTAKDYQNFASTFPQNNYDYEAFWAEDIHSSDKSSFVIAILYKGDNLRLKQLLGHELAHILLNRSGLPPLWLDEGFGLFVESCVKDDGLVFDGLNEAARTGVRQALSDPKSGALPLTTLLALSPQSDMKLTRDSYFQCWSVFYYLLTKDSDGKKKIAGYLQNITRTPDKPLMIFEESFNLKIGALEKEWRPFATESFGN